MRPSLLLIAAVPALALLASYAVNAQDAATTRRPVEAGSNWFIDDSDCAIVTTWEGDIAMWITRHEDHRDLGLYDPAFTGVVNEKVVDVSFGVDEKPADKQRYPAMSVNNADMRGYVATGDEGLLARMAASQSIQLYRGGKQLLTLDAVGMRQALSAMDVCTAKLSPPPAVDADVMEAASANMADTADADVAADNSNAVDAASDAAAAAAAAAAPKPK